MILDISRIWLFLVCFFSPPYCCPAIWLFPKLFPFQVLDMSVVEQKKVYHLKCVHFNLIDWNTVKREFIHISVNRGQINNFFLWKKIQKKIKIKLAIWQTGFFFPKPKLSCDDDDDIEYIPTKQKIHVQKKKFWDLFFHLFSLSLSLLVYIILQIYVGGYRCRCCCTNCFTFHHISFCSSYRFKLNIHFVHHLIVFVVFFSLFKNRNEFCFSCIISMLNLLFSFQSKTKMFFSRIWKSENILMNFFILSCFFCFIQTRYFFSSSSSSTLNVFQRFSFSFCCCCCSFVIGQFIIILLFFFFFRYYYYLV